MKWYENGDRMNYEKQKRCGTIKMWIKSLEIYLLLLCDVAVNRFWYHTINQTRVMFFSHWFIFFAFFHRYFGAWLLNLHCGAFFVGFEFEADKIRCAMFLPVADWLMYDSLGGRTPIFIVENWHRFHFSNQPQFTFDKKSILKWFITSNNNNFNDLNRIAIHSVIKSFNKFTSHSP